MKSLAERLVCEIRWRIVHRIVKVRVSLKEWGHNVVSNLCAVCGQRESIEHCFLSCKRVRRAWVWVLDLVGKWRGSFRICVEHVFLGLIEQGRVGSVVMYLVETMLYVIWKVRNRATFDNVIVPSSEIVRFCKYEVRCRLKAERYRLSVLSFKEIWCAGNVLCSSHDSAILF